MKIRPKMQTMASFATQSDVSKMFVLKGDVLAAVVGSHVA